MELRDGDIFRWSWNDTVFNERSVQRQAGTLYWACARFAIWHEKRKQLVDIWDSTTGSGEYVKRFSEKDIESQLDIDFVANINDLEAVDSSSKFNEYDSGDIIDIRHPNAWRGTCLYIKKGAKKSIEKKRRTLKIMLEREFYRAESAERKIESLNCKLEMLDSETYIPTESDLYVPESEEEIYF
jgi:hypothetical protein